MDLRRDYFVHSSGLYNVTMLFDTTRWNLSIVQFNLKMDKSHLDSVFVLQLKDILQIDNGNGQGKPFNVTVLLNVVQLKVAIITRNTFEVRDKSRAWDDLGACGRTRARSRASRDMAWIPQRLSPPPSSPRHLEILAEPLLSAYW